MCCFLNGKDEQAISNERLLKSCAQTNESDAEIHGVSRGVRRRSCPGGWIGWSVPSKGGGSRAVSKSNAPFVIIFLMVNRKTETPHKYYLLFVGRLTSWLNRDLRSRSTLS